MNGHMNFIIKQKEEVAYLRDKLEIKKSEAEDLKFLHKRISKAEEERMWEVIKTNSKIA